MGAFIPASGRRPPPYVAALGWLLLASNAPCRAAELKQGEIDISTDRIVTEVRTDTLELIGAVRLEQGNNVITADHGRLESSGDTNDARFEGSVRVRTSEAELRASKMDARLVKGALVSARAEGAPAEFRQLSGAADTQGEGRAGLIEYDVSGGEVKLTGGAEPVWFVYGKEKNELRTDVLTYNMRTGTVSTGRTRGTIRLNGNTSPAGERDATEVVADPASKREEGA